MLLHPITPTFILSFGVKPKALEGIENKVGRAVAAKALVLINDLLFID